MKVAAIGEPPTLDLQATTTVLTYERPNVESIEAKDPYTVLIHLKQPSGSLVNGLPEPATRSSPCAGSPRRNTSSCTRPRSSPSSSSRSWAS